MIRTVSLALVFSTNAVAGTPVVEAVAVHPSGDGIRFDVTLAHGDTGWDHYADGWGVYTLDGVELGYRTLFHPHVDEQPFTRSLTIAVPEGVETVIVRPRDSLHGDGDPFVVQLPKN